MATDVTDAGRDFVQAVARGLSVIRAFGADRMWMSLSEVAEAAELARPTARRLLLTLADLGYVRVRDGSYALTPRVLDLGLSYVQSQGLWELARPHVEDLVSQTGASSSIAQLDGSDIVYVARVAVPRIIALRVEIGTRFPALQASLGQVLLAELKPDQLEEALATPSRSGVVPPWQPGRVERDEVLARVRAQGYAVADEILASGIRSVAVPLRDGGGHVVASMNVTRHAAETPVEALLEEDVPRLREAASRISADISRTRRLPVVEYDTGSATMTEPGPRERPTG